MPGPAALAVPGAMMAMKRLAIQATALYSPEVATAVTTASIVAVLAKWIWKWIPGWIKEDISFQTIFLFNYKGDDENEKENNQKEERGREELTHLVSVLQSFHRMTQSMEELYEIPQLHAAILAFIKWSRQMKDLQLTTAATSTVEDKTLTRDYGYETAGRPLSLEEDVQTPEHQQALEFATWAYHRDTTTATTTTTTDKNNNKDTKNNSSKLARILQERDYELVLHHDQSTRPGHVAYYVAVSGIRRQMVIGIRGTSTLEDLVTDCCGHAAPLRHDDDDEERGRIEVQAERPHEIRLSQRHSSTTLEAISLLAAQEATATTATTTIVDDEDSNHDEVEIVSGHEQIRVEDDDSQGDNHIRCHEGILLSAQRMTKRIRPIIQDWAIDAGYSVVLCGHSLGGGAATLSALILRAQYPELEERLQVYAFAPPPVLDHDSAIASAPFVTSFVHNADLIPRCSLFNLAILLKGLKCIHERLKERNMNPTGPKTTATFIKQLFSSHTGHHISGDSDSSSEDESDRDDVGHGGRANSSTSVPTPAAASSSKLESTTKTKSNTTNGPLLTLEEWRDAIEDGTPEIRKAEHLFVAGRVLLIYSPWKDEEEQHHHHHHHDSNDQQRGTEQQMEDEDGTMVTPVASRLLRCVEADGTSPALRTIEADSPRLFTDHVTSSYFEALGMHYHFE